MRGQDRIEALEAGAGVVETRTGKLAGSEKREEKEQEGKMELAFPPTEDEKEQEAVIEAVLFTMGRSVELRQLAAAIGQPEEVARKAVERLIKRYRSARSGMEITQLEDSYQ
ncbi:MAG: SMC-Scp complex subunit ScpB, partial [Enterocloster clostridioformis]|nr:SMC-Scp complex subunit ScpB [Enterocloster clostridioformis]